MSGSTGTRALDPNLLGHRGHQDAAPTGRGAGGPAPRRVIISYGFWIFLLSDVIMFSAFFSGFAVLRGQTAGGPSGSALFSLRNLALETGCLLASTFTCGLASMQVMLRRLRGFVVAMLLTAVFGAAFLVLEGREFADLISRGFGPQRSAFLSAFFALVGCHGLHVTLGLLWLLTMMAQVLTKGFRDDICRRILCFTLFWHVLDIIWVAIFTVVYLLGAKA